MSSRCLWTFPPQPRNLKLPAMKRCHYTPLATHNDRAHKRQDTKRETDTSLSTMTLPSPPLSICISSSSQWNEGFITDSPNPVWSGFVKSLMLFTLQIKNHCLCWLQVRWYLWEQMCTAIMPQPYSSNASWRVLLMSTCKPFSEWSRIYLPYIWH